MEFPKDLQEKALRGIWGLVLIATGAFADNVRMSSSQAAALDKLTASIGAQQERQQAQNETIARIQEGQLYVLQRLSRIEDQLDGPTRSRR